MSNTVGPALQAAARRSAEIVQIANAILTMKNVVPVNKESVSLQVCFPDAKPDILKEAA